MSVRAEPAPGSVSRKCAAVMRAARPYVASLTAVAAAVLVLAVMESAVLWVTLVPLGGVLAIGLDRLREHLGLHRKGGKAAARKRRRWQGMASRREIRAKLSPAAAGRKTAVTCPDLDPAYAAVVIGEAKGRTVAGTWADSYLVFAPPQSMKTALVSCWAQDAPGALLAYSSRCDLYRHTAATRDGDVWVLNADGDGGIPTNFAWSPVDGCQNPRTAIRRAGDLMAASPRDSSGKDAWHEDRGAKLLRYALNAAAADGASMHEVAAWVHDPLDPAFMKILEARGHPGWAAKLASLITVDEQTLSDLIGAASAALGWMDDPVMAAAACPLPGEGFKPREFLAAGSGSVYLIGADRPHGSLAPYFAAFGAEMFEAAKSVAEDSGGRLRCPFVIVADEAATICPLPFHKMTAVSAGYNIGITACVQADSQLVARYGEQDAKTIRTNFTTKIIGPGFTDPGELEALSAVCGDVDTWDHVKNSDGSKTRQPGSQRLFPPERIRLLADWHALVLHRNTRPVEAVITPVWDRRGYEPVTPATDTRPDGQPAIEAPRQAIALPYTPAPPAIADTAPVTVTEEEPCHAAIGA